MRGSIIEINQDQKFAGRLYVKWVIHEIYPSDQIWNKNGISWIEKYVQNNIESAKNMPICVEFLDSWEKDEPFGHGFSDIKDGKPLFEYSVVVGAATNAFIDKVDIRGEQKLCLIGEGYIYTQRYPKFVQWLKSKMFDNDFPETSVEISAKDGNTEIIYDGGWKPEGRVPMVYDYSGSAILGIDPADDSAILLELNQHYKEDKRMAKTNEEAVVELNNKIDAKNIEINQLKDELKVEKDKVTEVNSKLEEKTTELNSTIGELKDVKKELEDKSSELEKLTSEVNELKVFKKEQEDKRLQTELNQALSTYSDDEKAVVKDKIEKFATEPSVELRTEIINEINSEIAKKIIEKRAEMNQKGSHKDTEDIYGDVFEMNNDDISDDDLY